MKKIIGILSILALIMFIGCTTDIKTDENCGEGITCNAIKTAGDESPVEISPEVEKIEVYHFHGESQCFSCRTIKEYAEKTVNTYYSDLIKSGKMEFKSINGELLENREVTIKYGATGSSLWIGTYINGEFHKENNVNVWYKVNDEADFTSYLKGLLDKRLAGDLS